MMIFKRNIYRFSPEILRFSIFFTFLIKIILFKQVDGLMTPGVGLKPAMGLSTVEFWGCNINEKLIREQVDNLFNRNFARIGYTTVLLGCGWYGDKRGDGGFMQENIKSFPSGYKNLTSYAHEKQMKIGLTQSVGDHPCLSKLKHNKPGLAGHEDQDIRLFAEWGIEHIKLEFCFVRDKIEKTLYPKFLAKDLYVPAVDSVYKHKDIRQMAIQINAWGIQEPQNWPAEKYANMWRMGPDVDTVDSWTDVVRTINQFTTFSKFVQPGSFVDLDVLLMGRALTSNEAVTQFSFWCLAKSPLFFSFNVATVEQFPFSVLTKPSLIEVNQDSLGKAISLKRRRDGFDLWSGPLSEKRIAVFIVNYADEYRYYNFQLKHLGLSRAKVEDLWSDEVVDVKGSLPNQKIPPHGALVYRLSESVEIPKLNFRFYSAGDSNHGFPSRKEGLRRIGNTKESAGCWIGHKETFEFRNISGGKKGGLKVVSISYIAADNPVEPIYPTGQRFGSITLNNGPEIVLTWPMTGGDNNYIYRDFRVDINGFNPGESNSLKFFNPKGWAPDIVEIGIQEDP
ncbi:glycoside hydrolase superfamily [Phakopsora pachyrhizi]|nr:glycoside hydrolase superfamily [Phakopsora pachyrhizi]